MYSQLAPFKEVIWFFFFLKAKKQHHLAAIKAPSRRLKKKYNIQLEKPYF